MSSGDQPTADENIPSSEVILMRMRNHIIDYLDLAASYEQQRECQAKAPLVHFPNDMINRWEDVAWEGCLERYVEPVFSADEQAAIQQYQLVWSSVCDDTPDTLPGLEELIGTEPWERLRIGAVQALDVFMRRGHSPFI